MRLPSADFESAASASSAIPARERHSQVSTRFPAAPNCRVVQKAANRDRSPQLESGTSLWS